MEGPYSFPLERLQVLQDPNKTPLVLVACGSFSPLTFLHLRMFEMARDHARLHTPYSIVGGYLSPVSSFYSKAGLASSLHRLNMCSLAVSSTSDWIEVDPWEARQGQYTPTAQVLDHFEEEINIRRGGVDCLIREEGTGQTRIEKRKARIMLLAGSDLILTMSEPGVWAEKDLHHILGRYGCYIIERSESELDQSIFSSSSVHSRSPLALYRGNIHMVDQLVRNDVSSTKVRMFLRKGMSVEYLIPGVVIKYIHRHSLYLTSDRDRSSPSSSSAGARTMTIEEENARIMEIEQAEQEREIRRAEARLQAQRRERGVRNEGEEGGNGGDGDGEGDVQEGMGMAA